MDIKYYDDYLKAYLSCFDKPQTQYVQLKALYGKVNEYLSNAVHAHGRATNAFALACKDSPIVGPMGATGNGLVNFKRGTLNELKDYVSWEVLACLLMRPLGTAPNQSLAQVFEAIADPKVKGGRAKHGYRFGWHSDLGSLRPSDFQSMARTSDKKDFRIPEIFGDIPRLNSQVPLTATNTSTSIKGNTTMEISSLSQVVFSLAQKSVLQEIEDHLNEWGTEINTNDIQPFIHVRRACTTILPDIEDGQATALHSAVELMNDTDSLPDIINGPAINVPDEAKHLVDKYRVEASTPLDKAMGSTPTASSSNDVIVDPNFAPMVNAVMGQVTKGKFNNIEDLVKTFNASVGLNNAAAEQINELTTKLTNTSKSVQQAIQAVPIDGITTKMEMVKASSIFKSPKGGAVKSLGFDIPTLKHYDPQGNEVAHHLVPAKDDHYVWRMKLLMKVLKAIANNDNSWLHGHTGTGKSTFVEQVAAWLNWPLIRVNLDGNIERADLTGEKDLIVDQGVTVSVFAEGILPQAMQQPCFLLLDEIDFGRADVMYVIQRALEGGGLMLTEDKGRVVQPHPLFRFLATGNTKGQGDEWGCYQGVRVLSTATLDRFTAWIHVPYLDADEELMMLKSKVPAINDNKANQMVQFAGEIRKGFIGGQLGSTLSPRGLVAMANYFVDFVEVMPSQNQALEIAVEMTLIDKMPDDNRQAVLELKNRCFK